MKKGRKVKKDAGSEGSEGREGGKERRQWKMQEGRKEESKDGLGF